MKEKTNIISSDRKNYVTENNIQYRYGLYKTMFAIYIPRLEQAGWKYWMNCEVVSRVTGFQRFRLCDLI